MVSSDAIDRWLPLLVRGIVPLEARERQNLAYSISCWNETQNHLRFQVVFLRSARHSEPSTNQGSMDDGIIYRKQALKLF